MHGAQRWLERDRDALVPMTPTTSAGATWPAPPPIEEAEVPIAHEPASPPTHTARRAADDLRRLHPRDLPAHRT
jgi:hypothetical protein